MSARRWAHPGDTATLVALVAALVAAPWRTADPDALTYTLLAALAALSVLTTGLLRRTDDARVATALLAVRDAERRDIARDLHDDVAHHVTGIVIAAQAAAVVSPGHPGAADAALRAIEQAGLEALTSMRSLVGVLRTASHDPTDQSPRPPARWPQDLHDLVDRFGRTTGLAVTIDVGTGPIPGPHQQAVLRVTQEALTNVRRHARHPTHTEVTVARHSDRLHLTITDNGMTRSTPASALAQAGGGFGLVGARERVTALGGTLQAAARPSRGWHVQATLPLPPPATR